eukprot:1191427-Prorocentrum_minimum.AAC.2
MEGRAAELARRMRVPEGEVRALSADCQNPLMYEMSELCAALKRATKVSPCEGLHAAVKPLISRSTTKEFDSPSRFRLKSAEDENGPLSP